MSGRYQRLVTSADLMEVRARAALNNNPAIAPRFLAEQTGMSIGAAISWLERNRGRG